MSWTLINTGHNGIYDYFSAVVFTSVNTGYIAGDLPSGIYFYQMRTSDFSETKKLILLK